MLGQLDFDWFTLDASVKLRVMTDGVTGKQPRRGESVLAYLSRFSRLWGFALFLVFVVVLFRQIVLPFIFAILVAYLLAPPVRRLQPRVGRAGAVIILYGIILLIVATFLGFLLPAVSSDVVRLKESAPELISTVNQDWVPKLSGWLESTFGIPKPGSDVGSEPQVSEALIHATKNGGWRVSLDGVRLRMDEQSSGSWIVAGPDNTSGSTSDVLKNLVATQGEELTAILSSSVQSAVAGVASFFTNFVLTFMLAGFMLVDLERVNRFIRSLVPSEYQSDFQEIVGGLDVGMSGVVRGQLLICLVNGVLTYIGLVLFGVKYSFLLGVTASIFSLIPIFGTIISSAPILAIALVSDPTGGKSLGMLIWISGIHLAEANYLNPKIIGTSAKIHPVVVVFSLLAGKSAFGLIGALLAVPVASVIQTVFLFARSRSAEVFGKHRDSDASTAEADSGG